MSWNSILKWISAFLGSLLSDTKPSPEPKPEPKPAPEPKPEEPPRIPVVDQEFLTVINKLRAQSNLQPLAIDSKLTIAAKNQASHMADIRKMTHIGLNGSSISERVSNANYHWSRVGENVASGYQTAYDVVKAWTNSPGHRRIMLGQYQHVGFGYFKSDKNYWAAVFAAPGTSIKKIVQLGMVEADQEL